MSTRAATFSAVVVDRAWLAPRLVRLVLGGPGLAEFATTGVPDEWVSLTLGGQFQTRYYTVRAWDGRELVLDVVVHDHGLVTGWAAGDCVGDWVTVSEPRGSFTLPEGARWLLVVGDLTALPAVARILETAAPGLPVSAWVESVDGPVEGYVAPALTASLTWTRPPAGQESATADLVSLIDWPEGDGYFWMAGESGQMRAIRKQLMRERQLPASAYDVMGYWRGGGQRRQPRSVDPGPIWAAGQAAGHSDEQIWAAYDEAQQQAQQQAQQRAPRG